MSVSGRGLLSLGLLEIVLHASTATAQSWEQNDMVFNPSGIPSSSFSQPRLADLDADGDFDLILGSIDEPPLFCINDGSATNPSFHVEPEVFSPVSVLDAEVGVRVDLDNDNDLDFVSGGFTGLNYFENTGDASQHRFEKVEGFFQGMTVGYYPVPACADFDADGDRERPPGYQGLTCDRPVVIGGRGFDRASRGQHWATRTLRAGRMGCNGAENRCGRYYSNMRIVGGGGLGFAGCIARAAGATGECRGSPRQAGLEDVRSARIHHGPW